jgi:tetratricopeptide (TPR) repeat protein
MGLEWVPHGSAKQSGRVTTAHRGANKRDHLEAAFKAAQASGDLRAQAKALNEVGAFYSVISRHDKAVADYQEALTQARAASDAQQQAAALNGIASCYRAQLQNDEATQTYLQAL